MGSACQIEYFNFIDTVKYSAYMPPLSFNVMNVLLYHSKWKNTNSLKYQQLKFIESHLAL
ncbi:hypothetical protein AGR1B_pTi0171 [Agrobacterium fabacearum S56]|uniref:Uncharacterized protein n=2 Tax=Agrobacterium TaxID=357 RepID=A0A3S6IBZ4_AGRTU|nr:hypothetical protein AgrTiEU6_2 [Agrobacterium tumefaciens]CUX06536.1 hypothetical protein AGR1B_pTi0171 [Agrobacterium fabacearum S56]CUX62651.1 hypothetical protein AGR7C_pTi0005 [Agrobacterium deltaense Zutra 3/1]